MLTPAHSEAIVTQFTTSLRNFPLSPVSNKKTSIAEAFEGEIFRKFQDFVANWESFLLYSEAVCFCIKYSLSQGVSRCFVERTIHGRNPYTCNHPRHLYTIHTYFPLFQCAIRFPLLPAQVVGSSLLFVYDSSGQSSVHMIDFGKTVEVPPGIQVDHRTPWEEGNHEDGYLWGLDNLISMWREL